MFKEQARNFTQSTLPEKQELGEKILKKLEEYDKKIEKENLQEIDIRAITRELSAACKSGNLEEFKSLVKKYDVHWFMRSEKIKTPELPESFGFSI